MTSQDRINIKSGAKGQVLDHFSFYILLVILWVAMNWIGRNLSGQNVVGVQRAILNGNATVQVASGAGSFALILTIVASMLRAGAQLTMIDIDRGVATLDSPVQRSFKLFEKGQYFLGWLFIAILTGLFTFFWGLLLVVPGIIKSYSYSQAFYIYRDAFDQGHPLTALEAITRSREMMDGSKGFLFIMDLSFLGWFILSALFFYVPDLFVSPYYDMSRAKFYNQLVVRKAGVAEDDDQPDDPEDHNDVTIE